MKIRCVCCGHKFIVETTDKGVPKTDKCDACSRKQEEKRKSNG